MWSPATKFLEYARICHWLPQQDDGFSLISAFQICYKSVSSKFNLI